MSRSLSGLSNNNVYVNSMFASGTAINIEQTSNNTQAKVNLDLSTIANTATSPADTDIYVLETNTGVIKKITFSNLTQDLVDLTSVQTLTNKTLTSPILTLPEINDASLNHRFTIIGSELAGNYNLTLPIITQHEIFVLKDLAQTLANKTLTSPVLTLPKISEVTGGSSFTYDIIGGDISASRNCTLPNLAANDTFVFESHAQTLTSKTLTTPTLDNPFIKGSGSGASYKYSVAGGAIGADRQLNLPAITGTDTLLSAELAQNVNNKTFGASCNYISPNFNEIVLDDAAGGSATTITIRAAESSNNQILTIPALSGDKNFVVTEATSAQTLVNIILTAPTINNPELKQPEVWDSNQSHTYRILGEDLGANRDVTIPAVTGADTFCMENLAQTLSNKALASPFLTTPKINDLDATHEYRITAPFNLADHRICNLPQLTETNDFVFNVHPQTLTNKTLTSPIMAEFKNSSGDNPLLVPQPTTASANNTIATVGDLKLNNAFANETLGALTLGNVGLSSTTYNSKTHIIECAGTDASAMNSVMQVNGSQWAWIGDSSGSGTESTYENIIQVMNPALKAYDSTTNAYPKLKLKLENSFGENLFLTSHDPDETCFWSALIMGSSSSGNPFYFTQGIAKNRASSNSWGLFQGGGGGDLHFEYQPASGSLTLKGWVGITPTSGSSKQMNFTGDHRCITENQDIINNINDYIGLVVYSTGKYNSIKVDEQEQDDPADTNITIDEAQPIVELTNTAKDKRVLGVISSLEEKGKLRDWGNGVFMTKINKKIINPRVHINALGEGAIKVCNQGGNIENGDLLCTSDISGLAMKQDDDLFHNYTIGKATQDYTFSNDTDYKLIGCTYHCG